MMKSLLLTIFLLSLAHQQTITPYYILPVQTTQNVITSYSFLFYTDTSIANNAWVAITFPFEFSPTALTQVSRVRYSVTGSLPLVTKWSVNQYQFLIQLNQIPIGNVTIVIDNVLNPSDYTTSSYFVVQTLFQNVVITSNKQFGRTPFTSAPIATSGGTVSNYQNTYIEQGSSWTFNFALSKTYPSNSSLRFIFPEGFISNQVQCNVSGNVDPNLRTRVFPAQNVYDCLNLRQSLTGNISVILSGVVNPNYQMTASGFQVYVLQPNNIIAQEIVSSTSTIVIERKPLKTTVQIPNKYRNNSVTYIFTINTDTDLLVGDYLQFTYTGLWKLFTNMTNIISGVNSDTTHTPVWSTYINTTSSITSLTLTNFSSILKSTQFTFYLPLVTPLTPNTYTLTITAYRSNGKIAQSYTNSSIVINQTTGYIRQMKLHPMQRAIKLPVGQTGPLEIVLFLQNDLPKTNVLTYGKIVIQITPNIPAPILSLNGVPKCYFYSNIPAVNCTFDSSNSSQTLVTIYTPADFNFQQSQVPLTITTEGYQQPQNQGITIDTLVKRYFFQIQFYSNLRPPPIPLEVIFDQWIPDSIPLTTLSCPPTTLNWWELEHLKCTFTTPNQVLNSAGHIHFFRVQFVGVGWSISSSSIITPNYPCLMYGLNVSAVPYVKCDLVTITTGPYASEQSSTSYNYITFYGLSTIPPGSTITFEVPNLQRQGGYTNYDASVQFSILEDTPGYSSPIVYLYSQTYDQGSTNGWLNQYIQYPSYTFTNPVINKVTNFTLNTYSLGTSGVTSVQLIIDQTAFPNIGRGSTITCGAHTCSKFDIPIQYFMLYPSSTLSSTASLTFPSITNPPYSGTYTFRVRTFMNGYTQKKSYFSITISPDTITAYSYTFSSLQSVSTLYPNSNHFYTIAWTTVNALQTLGGNAYILITINNIFTLSSTYCLINTTATAYDGRGIMCQLTSGGTQVYIKNLDNVPAATTFSITLQMSSTSITATVSPTVNIQTYYGNGNLVDQALNVPFTTTPLTNTNLTVFSSFSLPSAWTSTRSITAGYFGPLLISFTPSASWTVLNGTTIIVTMPTGFYPSGNTLGVPLRCNLNGVRFSCSYTLNPFTITIAKTNSSFTTGSNVINITTQYLNPNGITFPSSQDRYMLQLQIQNTTYTTISIQKVQQYIDILPPDVGHFNVSWAVRDIGVVNIFTFDMQNGATAIPSYNNGVTAGRIYLGFPTVDASNNAVFASNLGFSGITEGTVLPCYFDLTVSNPVTATSGQSLQCKIRLSQISGYYTWVEIVNFAAISAGATLRVIIAKVTNPALKQIDINFLVKVNIYTVATATESPLYQTTYNMFINMVSASISSVSQLNSSSIMFQPGSTVGQTNRYFNITPYTTSSFSNNDWFVINLDPQFPLSGTIYNCQQPFYQYCIIYPTINWLAIKIGNGTVISLQPFISQLPSSISRVDTTYTSYTFLQGRWAETITYTVTANARWLQIRGAVSGFSLTVLGSQNKLNVGQKNVEVLVSFNVSHQVPLGGTIQVQFPNSANLVPAIKPHCRSAVTLGSALNGYNTGKPSVNVQGEVGCLVQNGYSWIITGFAPLAAGSQVKIYGLIDFPLNVTTSLGMGYVCTYSNQDATSAFNNAKTIDYLSTNFPLSVQNLTWNLDSNFSMLQTGPVNVNHVGDLTFLLNLASTFYASTSGGAININLWYTSVLGAAGGFYGPSTNLVCIIINPLTLYKYGCYLSYSHSPGSYIGYTIQTYQNLPANTNLQVTLTTQKGSATEGLYFPTVVGSYKVEIQVLYSSGSTYKKNQALFIEVYGSNFNMLYFNSTVTIPNENNFIIVQFTPSSSIATGQQLIIEIPTISLDGQTQFPFDLGKGYNNYDKLVFDLFESGITSMTCKVYTGNPSNYQPVKIVCSSFSSTITTSTVVKFGFWVVNPSTTIGMAIPVQVYAYDQPTATKFCWSIVESGIRLLPITQTPITDIGNWASSSTYREIMGTSLSFTTRNTRALTNTDWYILKFNFDLRSTANSNGSLSYNSGLGASGDVIFMRNSMTILLRIGSTALNILTPGSSTINARINSLIYNPSTQLTTAQASILAYAIYNTLDACQKIIYSDQFPTLNPNQPSSPSFSMTSVYSNSKLGANDDYQFSFTMSSSAGNSTSLVQLISIQFPASSTYDLVLQGTQCYQYSTSTIEVSNCTIDTVNRVIWIYPVVQTTYSNNNPLIIESAGLAFQNPILSSSINLNQFVIRYYTWPAGTSNPGVVAGSDNWCFMKQDSSNLPSSTLSFTSTYYSPHTYINVPNQIYVNEWQPADTNIAGQTYLAKSPLSFKIVAPVAFGSLTGGQYHSLSVYFGSFYNTPSINQNSNDLYYYVPTCHLNGFSIYSCSISSGTITMNFQQSINNGAIFSVRFSIVNPKNEADQGFILANTNNPTVTLPIYLSVYGGSNYYLQPEPFHTFYRTISGSSYPSMGISSVTMAWGNQVQGQFNYLEFVITLTRNDINGFVLQIPVVNDDGTKIYNNAALLGLQSGSKYPCSLGVYVSVYCYYQQGSTTNFGTPTRIYITDFSIPANNSLSFRMLFTNPDIVEVFPSFTFKAFGGSFSAPNLMGSELKGMYKIVDPYKIYSTVNYYGTSSCTCYPTQPLWTPSTQYNCYVTSNGQGAGTYAVLQWPLVDATYGIIGDYNDIGNHYDVFFMSTALNQYYVFLVTKLTGSYGGYYGFANIRMKHHIVNSYNLYVLGKPWIQLWTASVSASWVQSNRAYDSNNYGQFSIDNFDVQTLYSGSLCWHYVSINTGSLYNFPLQSTDASTMVVQIVFNSGNTFSSLGASTACSIESGVVGNDVLNPVTCALYSSPNRFVIYNVFKLTNTQLKIYYQAYTAVSQSGLQVCVYAWANTAAYTDQNWPLYGSCTNNNPTLPTNIFYAYNPNNNNKYPTYQTQPNYYLPAPTDSTTGNFQILYGSSQTDTGGYVKLITVTSNTIVVRVYRSSNIDLSSAYRMGFRFYTQRLNPTGSCSASAWSSRYGNVYYLGYNGITSINCGTNGQMFYAVFYSYHDAFVGIWGQMYGGDYIDLTFSFSNTIGLDVSNNANYLFVTASIVYENTVYYTNDLGHCGCCSYCNYWACCNNDYCCWNGYYYYICCCSYGYCGSQYCCSYCSCRYLLGWNYWTITGNSNSGWAQPSTAIAQNANIYLVSNQYNVQTQFSFYLQNLYGSFSSTMTSGTVGNNAELIITFTGNNVFPNSNAFGYTTSSQTAASIQCLCVVSNSGISISAGTSYTAATCTRYLGGSLPLVIGVRINANTGQYLACYFPGFSTPTSSGNGGYMYANFYRETMHFFKQNNVPSPYWTAQQTTGVSIGLTTNGPYSGFNSVTYYGYFWTTYGNVYQNKYYQLYVQSPYYINSPIMYVSSYSPQFSQSICNSGTYAICRAYNDFYSRRYFLVVQYSGYTYSMNLVGNLNFPQSKEYSSSYYTTYIGWTGSGFSYYYNTWSGTLNQGYLSEATPTISYSPSLYGSNLNGYQTSMSISISLSSVGYFNFYSNQRTQGAFMGSFIRLTMSGFSSIYGCGAFLWSSSIPTWLNNGLYCVIQSSNQINIYTNSDLYSNDNLYITFNTASLPTSTTYIFQLFDRYVSSTNYGRSIYTTGSFARNAAGYTLLQPTSIKWRRQAYKQLMTSSGPIKFTLNNNFQYVSSYDVNSNSQSTSSSAILVTLPAGSITSSNYYCLARQYPQSQHYLYTEYVIPCQYYSANQVMIRSIPSHILNPIYYYDFIIYLNAGSATNYLSTITTTPYIFQVSTLNAYTGGTILYNNYIPVDKYQTVYPITLSSIYILTQEAAAVNSLYLNLVVNQASSTVFYLQFVFDNLDLKYFGISNGNQIPCYLSAGFTTYGSKTKGPRCFGYASGINNTSPLIIRVLNFGGITSGTNLQLAFDNFNNPPIQTLFAVPINVHVNFKDRTNNKVYSSYFKQLYLSQSASINIPTNLGGSLSRTSSYRGVANTHYLNLGWPYNSNSGDISQKLVMKIAGGITSVQSFSSLTLGYSLLWCNTNANTSIYQTPSISNTANTNISISNVVNPQAVNAPTNDQLLTITFIFYVSYKTTYLTTLNQFSFSSYSMNTDFTVTGAAPLVDSTANFNFQSAYPMTYDFTWSFGASNYNNRNISYIVLYFTSGISSIDAAWLRYGTSPSYFNAVGCTKIGYNSVNSQWYVNITGVSDSIFSTSYAWYVRVRLYANANNFYYTSYVYNFNGYQEFTSTSGGVSTSSSGFNTSSNLGNPTTFALSIQRYTKGYYELSSSYLYAQAGLTTNKLFFKFVSPYNISQVESFSFISSSTSYPAPTNTADGIHCMIQPTVLAFVTFGAGLYAPCTYSGGVYTVQAPVGGLTTIQYLLTIIGRKQLTTSFNMPTTPQRIQISLIYNDQLSLQYGDVYTLDYAGLMTSYSIDHAHLISGQYDMLGFRFTPSFSLAAASTSPPVTESVLSFEIQSNYYDSCLGIQNIFSSDGMSFYSGVYYSHYSSPAVTNANTRILCGQNTQGQNWAPIKLTVTDYGAVNSGTLYYFRFPLIIFPSGNAVPLTYKVKLLQYSNNYAYPTIINQFRYENLVTASTTAYYYNRWATFSFSNNYVQQSAMSVYFSWNSYNIPNGVQNIVKFDNNNIPALTSLSNLPSVTNGDYNYQYYPNINLCSFIKINTNANNGFSLGTFPTSTDTQSFQITWVRGFWSSNTIYYGWFNSGTNIALYTINYATSWTTSSFTKVSCLLTTYSWCVYSVSWMASYLSFPQGSYMVLTFPAQFNLVDQYCLSYTGFIQGINSNSNLVCKRYSSNQILIAGYSTLSSSASLSMSLYLQVANINANGTVYYYPYVSIVVYSSKGNIIISANTNTYTLLLTQTGSTILALSGTMTLPYTKGNSFPLFITFQLNTHTLTNGDYLIVDFGNWVLDTATSGVQIFKYQISGNIYWVPSAASLVSGNIYNVPVYSNYSMTAGTPITLRVDTLVPTTYYGAMDNNIQWNTFKIYAYHSSTLVEQSVTRIWTEPFSHTSLSVSPSLTYVGATTLYQFSVTPNVSASAGDTILIEFTTADGYKTTLFSNNLGVTIPTGLSANLDCNQYYNTHIISSSIIKCSVYAGVNTNSPPTPTTIAIPITKNIAANTAIQFNIINILNPSVASYPIGIVFKLATVCSSLDTNNLCSYYKSSTYLTFTSSAATPSYFLLSNQLTFNPSRVSATNTVHTISSSYSLASGDFVILNYYSQVPIPAVCSITSGNGVCYSYPTTNTIIIKATTTIPSPFTFTLAGMTNPYQNYYGDYTFGIYIWHAGYISNYYYSTYSATTITTDPVTNTALGITFTPTLTPNYELKYSFNNIALITINNMLQNSKIQQIYITAPGQIAINVNYCNATMQTYPGQALPYPYRFVCVGMNANWVRLNLQSDFPTWTSNFTSRKIYVYLKYQIANTQTVQSNPWTAYAYTDPTSTSNNYLVSQATGNFPIVQYQLPFLYVINFPTQSFSDRTCAINEQCMFYGFLYPTTPPSSGITISYMTFLLPKQFGYSTLSTFDSCTVQPTTTSLSTFSCGVTRNNSQITIAYNPPTYNQLYNLINIDNTDATKLFTAPAYPGNHYQMQVNLWSSTNALVQSQYVNLTTVYGYYLSVPSIVCSIPLDASTLGLIDLQFVVGSVDILPSYINSASNSITSAIEISFANTFAADLGTGLAAGSNISCLNVSGLTFNTMGSITCRIYPSVSTVTYPTIIVTGYDRITAGTTVRIRFANLKSLPANITDYMTLGVSLTYYYYGGVKGYIYQPVSFVVGPTTAPITPIAITYTVTQLSTNIVGQLSNYTLSGTIANGFQTVTTNDFIVVTFRSYVFEGRFNLNTQALCSLASGNQCSVFGLASQIYIQPSTSISSSSFSFTIKKLLNAAYKLSYVNQPITLYTLVNNKINALGTATLQKFTQYSPNVSAIITSIDSIYGGDSGINYYFQFQLNSYLPEGGKVSITFPSIYLSLFTLNSQCYLRADSQLLIGSKAYCSIISSSQLVIVPNGVLLSTSQAYYFTVTNITNPNVDLKTYKFTIQTFYFTNVYNPSIISSSTFSSPILSLITVKQCQLQVNLSIYNPSSTAQYQINLQCPTTIKQASLLKLYLSWNPATSSQICSGDASVFYSTQCNIATEYSQTTKLTYLGIYLRQISAQKLISITGFIPNGNQGTYQIKASINYNGFVYLNATSNRFYINSPTTTSSSLTGSSSAIWQTITVKNANYPLNRNYPSIYTFSITNPQISFTTLQIGLPSALTSSSDSIACGSQQYNSNDNYFNLLIQQGTNVLSCSLNGQTIIIYGLSTILSSLSSTGFLYITVSGLINPSTSLSQSNFTFTLINTTTTTTSAVRIFTLPLSYAVSNAPLSVQIANITLSNSRYYVLSTYTFTMITQNSANITIVQSSSLGLLIIFPSQYSQIWSQIPTPTSLNLTINSVIYTSTNITLTTGKLFAVFTLSAFSSQVIFTNFTINFLFRNPTRDIACTVDPVFQISLFDFKGNSIFVQSLSNNIACPTFTTKLYAINVTGNTKISAGSSSTFIVSLEQPAQYLAITPICVSSAISFSPSTIVFSNYASTTQNFTISAANGLQGSYNVTFNKTEGSYIFYNDIQLTTLNIYSPTNLYNITITPFSAKSVGLPITVTIMLEVASPSDFALLFTNTCNSGFVFNPTTRIPIPQKATNTTFTITYQGSTIPPSCRLNFTISSLTKSNFVLSTPVVYLSSSLSIDKTSTTPPMILTLSTSYMDSSSVGHTIVNSNSKSKSKYIPYLYSLSTATVAANSATFTATTSDAGTIYYVVTASGTPQSSITQALISSQNVVNSITYGSSTATLNTVGVNIVSNFTVKGLAVQTTYLIAAYLNSTVGSSSLIFTNFTTSKASNGAAIKLATNSIVDNTYLLTSLSKVLRISTNRLYILTITSTLNTLNQSYDSTVMNKRSYIYEIVVAPDLNDDSKKPLDLLNNFAASSTQQQALLQFVSQFISSLTSTTREIVPTKPKVRSNISISELSHDHVTINVGFWDRCYVYGIIVPSPSNKALSSQIIAGLDVNNKAVVSQNYISTRTDQDGSVQMTFSLLNDNTSYIIFVSAEFLIPYQPRLSLSDSEVLSQNATTRVNLNLRKNQNAVFSVINQIDPQFAAIVKDHIDNINLKNNVIGNNRNKKRRSRS